MYRHLTLLSIFLSLFAHAEMKEKCEIALSCENGGKEFFLQLKSTSGDCTEDDMEAMFESKEIKKNLRMKKDWYFYTDHIAKTQPSVCEGQNHVNDFAAYSIDNKRIILFLKSSGRPGYDRVNAILLNTESGEVLDFNSLGISKNHYVAVLKTKRGYKVRIVRDSLSFHKQVTCDCDAPFVDDWMEVFVSRGKVKTSWHN